MSFKMMNQKCISYWYLMARLHSWFIKSRLFTKLPQVTLVYIKNAILDIKKEYVWEKKIFTMGKSSTLYLNCSTENY